MQESSDHNRVLANQAIAWFRAFEGKERKRTVGQGLCNPSVSQANRERDLRLKRRRKDGQRYQ